MKDELKSALIEFYKTTNEFWDVIESGAHGDDERLEALNKRIDELKETIKGFGV